MKKSSLESEFDTAQASPGFLLWQITNQWQSEQRKALGAFDLTHVQFVLLASLVASSDNAAVSQKELATQAKTDVMMTSQVVRTLQFKDLLVRQPSPADGRVMLVRPTVQGVALVNKAIKVVENVDRHFFAKLGPDVKEFTTMMHELALP